jgi:hypothetical protein
VVLPFHGSKFTSKISKVVLLSIVRICSHYHTQHTLLDFKDVKHFHLLFYQSGLQNSGLFRTLTAPPEKTLCCFPVPCCLRSSPTHSYYEQFRTSCPQNKTQVPTFMLIPGIFSRVVCSVFPLQQTWKWKSLECDPLPGGPALSTGLQDSSTQKPHGHPKQAAHLETLSSTKKRLLSSWTDPFRCLRAHQQKERPFQGSLVPNLALTSSLQDGSQSLSTGLSGTHLL